MTGSVLSQCIDRLANMHINQEFHLFPLLPLEIRQQIWRAASKESNIISIGRSSIHEISIHTSHKPPQPTPPQPFTIPSLLITSHESRASTLHLYTSPKTPHSSALPAFFNPNIDTMYFGCRALWVWAICGSFSRTKVITDPGHLDAITSLAVEVSMLYPHAGDCCSWNSKSSSTTALFARQMSRMVNLSRVFIVVPSLEEWDRRVLSTVSLLRGYKPKTGSSLENVCEKLMSMLLRLSPEKKVVISTVYGPIVDATSGAGISEDDEQKIIDLLKLLDEPRQQE